MPFVDCEMGSYGSEETLGSQNFIGIGRGEGFWRGGLWGGLVETEWYEFLESAEEYVKNNTELDATLWLRRIHEFGV